MDPGLVVVLVLSVAALQLWLGYLILKAAVRNGSIEAHHRLHGRPVAAPVLADAISVAPSSTDIYREPLRMGRRLVQSCRSQAEHGAHKFSSRDGGRMCPGHPSPGVSEPDLT
jgi:hypothetical protein